MTGIHLAQLGDGIAARIAPADGEKILWLHGYTMDSRVWTDLWTLLPGWFHIGIDLPGHGASRQVIATELSNVAQRIGRVADGEGVRHIVALSFGTIVALEINVRMPTSFATLTLGAPVLPGGPEDPSIRLRYTELLREYRSAGLSSRLRRLWMSPSSRIFEGAARRPELWNRLSEIVDTHTWSELGGQRNYLFQRLSRPDVELRRIQSATLILVGENEIQPFKRTAELIRRLLPDCRRLYIPQSGHLCMLEEPNSAAQLIAQHLLRHSDAGTGDKTHDTCEPDRRRS